MEDGKNGTERYIFVRYASSYVNSRDFQFFSRLLLSTLDLDGLLLLSESKFDAAISVGFLGRGKKGKKGKSIEEHIFDTSAFSKFVPFDPCFLPLLSIFEFMSVDNSKKIARSYDSAS